MEALQMIASPAISALIGAVVAAVFNWARQRTAKEVNSQKALVQGMRVLLRNELVEAHREYVETSGTISLEALEYIEGTYNAYYALGGNGSGAKLWMDIKALPIQD